MATTYSIPQAVRLLCAGLLMLVVCIAEVVWETLTALICWVWHNFQTVLLVAACGLLAATFVPMLVAFCWLVA